MRVEIQRWSNGAVVRLPARALKDAGLQIGQSLQLRVEESGLVMGLARGKLEDLLARMTSENRHTLRLEDSAVGSEV